MGTEINENHCKIHTKKYVTRVLLLEIAILGLGFFFLIPCSASHQDFLERRGVEKKKNVSPRKVRSQKPFPSRKCILEKSLINCMSMFFYFSKILSKTWGTLWWNFTRGNVFYFYFLLEKSWWGDAEQGEKILISLLNKKKTYEDMHSMESVLAGELAWKL